MSEMSTFFSATISREDWEKVKEFVKRKLGESGIVTTDDIALLVPHFNVQSLRFLLLADVVRAAARELGIKFLAYDDALDGFKALKEEEYDPTDPNHVTPGELDALLESREQERERLLGVAWTKGF